MSYPHLLRLSFPSHALAHLWSYGVHSPPRFHDGIERSEVEYTEDLEVRFQILLVEDFWRAGEDP